MGPDEARHNPLSTLRLPHLESLAGGRLVSSRPGVAPSAGLRPLDACLDTPGLPQSGTGQTSLLTGRNAARLLGEHQGPYPGARLRALLSEGSIWRRVTEAGLPAAFANAYPERYLSRTGLDTGRMGAFARSALQAGLTLRGPAELRDGRAASAFLTNRGWREHLGYRDIPEIDEAEAGRRVARLAMRKAFTCFEYYATDIAGHRPERMSPAKVLQAYDRFLGGVLSQWPKDAVLVLASDHGNIEDSSSRRHTRNPALGLWRGPAPTRALESLTDLAPAILEAMGLEDVQRSGAVSS